MKKSIGVLTFLTMWWLIVHGASAPDPLPAFLSAKFNLETADLRILDGRRPVVRTLDVADSREISTLGAIRVNVPPRFYVEQLRDIANFKRSDAVLQIGVFSTPADPNDAAGLTLDAGDVEDLRRCRPGACQVQLSSDAMLRIAREVPWDTPKAAAMADAVFRSVLADMVNRYREIGDAALMTYVDGEQPLSMSEQFRSLVGSPPMVLSRFPLLRDHFRRYPANSAERIQDIVYWSKEKLGPATVVSVTHMAVAQVSADPVAFAAASRQLFGMHYFDASLGITVVIQASGSLAQASSYVVYVNRSRLDMFGGLFGGLKRAIVKSRVRSDVSRTLLGARDRVERRFHLRRGSR